MAQCPKCGGNVTFSRESTGSKSKRASVKVGKVRFGGGKSTSNKRTVGLCRDCGYTFKAGKGSSSGSKLWLWVLGWIFLLPVPLGIILYRNQTMKKNTKIGIFAAACVAYLFVIIAGGNRNNNNDAGNVSDRYIPITEETTTEETASKDITIIIPTTAEETIPETTTEDITETPTEIPTEAPTEAPTISTIAEPQYKYIVNSSNGKIHKITCNYPPDEKLCIYFYTLDAVYAAGYSDGCGHCMK